MQFLDLEGTIFTSESLSQGPLQSVFYSLLFSVFSSVSTCSSHETAGGTFRWIWPVSSIHSRRPTVLSLKTHVLVRSLVRRI